jgi:hypothetical protein
MKKKIKKYQTGGPGPIQSAVNTIKMNRDLRNEEKVRAAEQGYGYNRNIVHPDNKSPMMLKGSVAASVASGIKNKKEEVQASVAKVKSSINQMKESAQARKAAEANENRAWSGRDNMQGKSRKTSGGYAADAGYDEKNTRTQQEKERLAESKTRYKSDKPTFIGRVKDNIQRMKQTSTPVKGPVKGFVSFKKGGPITSMDQVQRMYSKKKK